MSHNLLIQTASPAGSVPALPCCEPTGYVGIQFFQFRKHHFMVEIGARSLASVRRVFSAEQGAILVNGASMIGGYEPAFIGYIKKPFAFLNKKRDAFVCQVPSKLFKILF